MQLVPIGFARLWRHALERPPLDFAEQVARVAPATVVNVLAPGEALVLPA